MVVFNLVLALTVGKGILVNSLILELGSDEFRRRERATQILARFGPFAYSELRVAQRSKDLEIRRRATRLVQSIHQKVFRIAADRQVLLYPSSESKGDIRHLGIVISADGREAWVLTTLKAIIYCRDGGVVEWVGKKYPFRCEKFDDVTQLALVSIRYKKRLAALPLARGEGEVCWWNNNVVDAPFKEASKLFGGRGTGGCFFILDETSWSIKLAGVDCGELGDRTGGLKSPWVADSAAIRKFLPK